MYACILLLEIQLSSGEGWEPINWLNPATFLPGHGFLNTLYKLWIVLDYYDIELMSERKHNQNVVK